MKKIIFTWGPEFTLKMSLGNQDSRSKQVEQFSNQDSRRKQVEQF